MEVNNPTSDPFEILGLKHGSPLEEVRRAYTSLARQWHPDKNQDTDTTGQFQKLNEAYCQILAGETNNIDIEHDSLDSVEQFLNSASVYLRVHQDIIHVWLNECQKKYNSAQIIDRGDNGIQLKMPNGTPNLLGSLSITIYKSTAALHVQGTSAFLWLEEDLELIKYSVEKSSEFLKVAAKKKKRHTRTKRSIKNKKSCPFCFDDDNTKMMMCNDCESMIHYKCTRLATEVLQKKLFTAEKFKCPACQPIPDIENEAQKDSTDKIYNLQDRENDKPSMSTMNDCPSILKTPDNEIENSQDKACSTTEIIHDSNLPTHYPLKLSVNPNDKGEDDLMIQHQPSDNRPQTNYCESHILPNFNKNNESSKETGISNEQIQDGPIHESHDDNSENTNENTHSVECGASTKSSRDSNGKNTDGLERNDILDTVSNKQTKENIKSKFLERARAMNTPTKAVQDSNIWSKAQSNHLAILETNITQILTDIKEGMSKESEDDNINTLTKKINCLQDALNKKMKEVIDNQKTMMNTIKDVVTTQGQMNLALQGLDTKVSDINQIQEPTITEEEKQPVVTVQTQTEVCTTHRSTQCNFDNTNPKNDKSTAQNDTHRDHVNLTSQKSDSDCGNPVIVQIPDTIETEIRTDRKTEPQAEKTESAQDKNPDLNRLLHYDVLVVGNSNMRNINGDMFYKKHHTHIVTLRNKSIRGAVKFMRNIKISSTLVVFHIGINELGRNPINDMKSDLRELIQTTKQVLNIAPENILITSIPHRDHSMVISANNSFKEVCDKMRCQFVKLDVQQHHFEDEVHLNNEGIKVLTSAVKANANPILQIKSSSNTQSRNSWKDQPLYFAGSKNILSNFYPSELQTQNTSFPTAEHLFQYRRAIVQNEQKLADRILHAETAMNAKALGKNLQKNKQIDKHIMTEVLMIKANQCRDFLNGLKDSYSKELIENTKDPYWGRGTDGMGLNTLGKLLMELRDSIQSGEYKIGCNIDMMKDLPQNMGTASKNTEKSANILPRTTRHLQSLESTEQDQPARADTINNLQTPAGNNLNITMSPDQNHSQTGPSNPQTPPGVRNIAPPQWGNNNIQTPQMPQQLFPLRENMAPQDWGSIQGNNIPRWKLPAPSHTQFPNHIQLGANYGPNYAVPMSWNYSPTMQMVY